MGKLIDADALTDEIKETKKLLQKGLGKDAEFAYMSADSVLKTIYNQPTAYDPDKVVEQLEGFREEMEQFKCGGMLSDMIEVVEAGGVDEEANS